MVSESKEKDIPTGSPAWEDKKGVGVEFVWEQEKTVQKIHLSLIHVDKKWSVMCNIEYQKYQKPLECYTMTQLEICVNERAWAQDY